MRPPPSETPPLLFGPNEVTEGYYELETTERRAKLECLIKHKDLVALWYRALTLYRQGVMGKWDVGVEQDDPRLAIWGLQSQLLGLGLSSAKAALDMLLAGYYSIAYAAIRHMLETVTQQMYVVVKPDEVKLWYEQPGGLAAQKDPPQMFRMVQAIKTRPDLISPDFIDRVYDAWKLMCKGAHPSGQGIYQTVGDSEGKRFIFGAAYGRDLCITGFGHGLFAIDHLLVALVVLREQSEEWKATWLAQRGDVSAWRDAAAAELKAAEGESGPTI